MALHARCALHDGVLVRATVWRARGPMGKGDRQLKSFQLYGLLQFSLEYFPSLVAHPSSCLTHLCIIYCTLGYLFLANNGPGVAVAHKMTFVDDAPEFSVLTAYLSRGVPILWCYTS